MHLSSCGCLQFCRILDNMAAMLQRKSKNEQGCNTPAAAKISEVKGLNLTWPPVNDKKYFEVRNVFAFS